MKNDDGVNDDKFTWHTLVQRHLNLKTVQNALHYY